MSQSRRERRPLRIAVAIALGAAGLVAAAWGSAYSLGIAATEDARIWLPETPKGAIALVERRFATNQRIEPADKAVLESIADDAPLAHQPFALLGFAALQDGDIDQAEALLSEARGRRPRSRLARLSLLQIHGQRGNIEPMVAELVPLIRLEPELVGPLVSEWLKVLRRPEEVEMLADILQDDPSTYDRVAEQATRSDLSPEILAAFLANDPRGQDREAARSDRLILVALVEQGDYASAFAGWRTRSDVERADAASLFNGDFSDTEAPPPFNWDALKDRQGLAELRAGSAFVDYFGRGSGTFLRQLVTLPPGRYELAAQQEIVQPSGSGLTWPGRCAGTGSALLDSPIRGASADTRAAFSVPADCAAQWVALEGRGELRQGEGQRVTVNQVSIGRVGAAQ